MISEFQKNTRRAYLPLARAKKLLLLNPSLDLTKKEAGLLNTTRPRTAGLGRLYWRRGGYRFTAQAALPLTLFDVTARLIKRAVFAMGRIALDGINHQGQQSLSFEIAFRPLCLCIHSLIRDGLYRFARIE